MRGAVVAIIVLVTATCGRFRFDAVGGADGTGTDASRDGVMGDGVTGDVPAGVVVHIQAADGDIGGSDNVSATFPAPSSAGDLIAVAFQWDDNGTFVRVTDSDNNNYMSAGAMLTTGTHFAQIAYAPAIAADAAPITVTAYVDAMSTKLSILVEEIRGADPATPVVSFNAQGQMSPGSGADAISTGPLTLSGANDYVLGASFDASGNTAMFTNGTGFTTAHTGSNGSTTYISEYGIDLAPATFTTNLDVGTYMTLGMVFRPAP